MPPYTLTLAATLARAIVFIGVCLMMGFVLPVAADNFKDAWAAEQRGDYTTALRLYRSLADQGNATAQANLCVMYHEGRGVSQNYADALKWCRLAANQGNTLAQKGLGFIYHEGEGVPLNYAEALKWYRLAANQGDPTAQSSLGRMYHEGEGMPQNYAEALKWYRLAANQGDPTAQSSLGVMYQKGQGAPQNYISAHMWFSLAAAQGNEDGIKGREIVAGLMTSGQIAEAQRQATEWTPKTGDLSADLPQSPSPKKTEIAAASGTAFFVSAAGDVLTNAHVVEGCHQIRVNGSKGRLLSRDNKNDLALIATGPVDRHEALVPGQNQVQATLRASVQLGEDIVVYGFPLAGVLSSGGNVVTGNVTALSGLGDDSRFLQISAPVQPGNSGGPLLDRQGNVVGIVVSKLDTVKFASATGDIPQNVNFAIKTSVVLAFLDAQGITPSEAPATARSLSTPEIARLAQRLVARVVCFQ